MSLFVSTYRRRALLATISLCAGFGFAAEFSSPAHADVAASPRQDTAASKGDKSPDTPDAPETDSDDSLLVLPLTDPALPPSAAQERGNKPSVSPLPIITKKGQLTVKKFQNLQWSPGAQTFSSRGSVQILYKDPENKADTGTTLTLRDFTGNAETGDIEAKGGARLERADGVITGRQMQYNFLQSSGSITDAIAVTDFFRMSGKTIQADADGTYSIQDGLFTTCVNGRPDYQIRARQLKVSPNKYVKARKVTFYAGGTKLITIPSYRTNLSSGASAPVPTPGYNKNEGVTLRFHDTPVVEPGRLLSYDFQANFKRRPAGFVTYEFDLHRAAKDSLPPNSARPLLDNPLRGYFEQLSPPTYRDYNYNLYPEEPQPRTTFFAAIQASQFVFNRQRNDLLVSRFPEVGIRFANILGHATPPSKDGAQPDVPTLSPTFGETQNLLKRLPNAPFLFNVTASLAELHESPTSITTGRFNIRTDIATQPILIGRRLSWRVGASNWSSLYGTGTAYNLFSPEAELNYVPTRTSLFGIGYRMLAEAGKTPFFFDRRDIRNEVRLRYQVGGPWAFGLVSKIDVDRSRAYDAELAILRNFDCMQIGIVYRARSQSINLVFNLLPPTANRESHLRSIPNQIGSFEPPITAEAAP